MKTAFIIILTLISLTGCASGPIYLKLRSSTRLNLTEGQQSLPVVVRIYQLRDSEAFSQATFWELWREDRTVLSDTMLGVKELVVSPGQTRTFELNRVRQANYLGVIAIFRHRDEKAWRVIHKLPPPLPLWAARVGVQLNRNKIYGN